MGKKRIIPNGLGGKFINDELGNHLREFCEKWRKASEAGYYLDPISDHCSLSHIKKKTEWPPTS